MLSVVALVSGVGSNLQALMKATAAPDFAARIVAVGADRPAPALDLAAAAGIPTFLTSFADFEDRAHWANALGAAIDSWKPDLVVLSGLMRVLPPEFVARYAPRLINTHPAYLPEFPGHNAVAQALAAGVSETGATVHIVDAGVDTGPVLRQERVPVVDGDTELTLHNRIKVVERRLLIDVVHDVAVGSLDLVAQQGESKDQ